MEAAFELKIFVPEGVVLDEKVQSATLHTADGEIGILPGHARYIGLLGTGIMSFTKPGGERTRFVASEGFCYFTDGVLTVLADSVDFSSDASGRDLSAEREALQRELAGANFFDPAWDVKAALLKRIQALQQL